MSVENEQEYQKRALRTIKVKERRNEAIELLEEVILSLGSQLHSSRYIQNFSIRLNVWRAFIGNAKAHRDLILTPNYLVPIDAVVSQIRGALTVKNENEDGEVEYEYPADEHRLITLSNSIHLRITLTDLLSKLLPQTYWYKNKGRAILKKLDEEFKIKEVIASITANNLHQKDDGDTLLGLSKRLLGEDYVSIIRPIAAWTIIQTAHKKYEETLEKGLAERQESDRLGIVYENAELERYSLIERYSEILLDLSEATSNDEHREDFQGRIAEQDVDLEEAEAFLREVLNCLEEFVDVYLNLEGKSDAPETREDSNERSPDEKDSSFADKRKGKLSAPVWSIDVNRLGDWAVATSRMTIKADAAHQVFGGETQKISWAVIDSGVDATHIAFIKDPKKKQRVKELAETLPREDTPKKTDLDIQARLNKSRVKATYDFYRLMHMFQGNYHKLVPENILEDIKGEVEAQNKKLNFASDNFESLSSFQKKRIKDRAQWEMERKVTSAIFIHLYKMNSPRTAKSLSSKNLWEALEDKSFLQEAREYASSIKRILKTGQPLDWHLIEPLLKISHRESHYEVPENPHGTHVAGILAGDIKKHSLSSKKHGYVPYTDHQGVCPNMGLYDLRVSNAAGQSEEFLVLAAMQFISYLNRNRNLPKVHGANVSLSLKHAVKDYACGQTPICVESNRLVGEGVVVVAAAGNLGFKRLRSDTGLIQAYNAVSITDPGNAANVITVGSTYRDKPHIYGVSYFSSRGPTGDGRQKPDIVAPGERIFSALSGNGFGVMDGTSMAAPHVSGAAALLMARHEELIGNPLRVKSILCETATDIGRVKQFQGAGLVDIFRALQSV